MEKQSIIFIAIALVIGFVLGLLVVLSINTIILPNKDIEVKKMFVDELREKGILPSEPESITDAYGKAKNIGENQLSIIVEERFDDPLGEFLPKEMIIKISEETEIFTHEEKPSNVFEQEQREFDKQMNQYDADMPAELMPPDPFVKIMIKLSDIKEGDFIMAFSENDFKGKTKFTAISIQIEQQIEPIEEMPVE